MVRGSIDLVEVCVGIFPILQLDFHDMLRHLPQHREDMSDVGGSALLGASADSSTFGWIDAKGGP